MHPSFGPQVGPSSSARFIYEDLILRSISDLSNRITTLGTQQQQMLETMTHNTQSLGVGLPAVPAIPAAPTMPAARTGGQ